MPTVKELNARAATRLPGLIGIEIETMESGKATGRLTIRPELLAPNGFLHAATIVALADTTCGHGTFGSLPDDAQAFTTIELKTNFLGTAREGIIRCEAMLMHGGRMTQVWDAAVTDAASGRTIALFRCTQMILYSR